MFEERRGCYADWELLERQREVCQAALGEEEEYALSLAKTQVLVPPTGIHPCDNVTKPLRILLILKSPGLLANET
jgi:hypothetical protein